MKIVQIKGMEPREFSPEAIDSLMGQLDIKKMENGYFSILNGAKSHVLEIVSFNETTKEIVFSINGKVSSATIKSETDLMLEKLGIDMNSSQKMNELKAPMPGLVVDYFVEVGQKVNAGDKLLILEAMKMENVIKATGEGVIKSIEAAKGSTVEKNQIIIKFG